MAKNLIELIEKGYVSSARLPKKNDFLLPGESLDLSKLETFDGYTVPLIAHDHSAKTSEMWNALYEKLGLNIRNIMAVADPNSVETVMSALRADPESHKVRNISLIYHHKHIKRRLNKMGGILLAVLLLVCCIGIPLAILIASRWGGKKQ